MGDIILRHLDSEYVHGGCPVSYRRLYRSEDARK